MEKYQKFILLIIGIVFYGCAYLLLRYEIFKIDYSIISIVVGIICILIGLLAHFGLFFEEKLENIENRLKRIPNLKNTIKIISTILILTFGCFVIYVSLFAKTIVVSKSDLYFIKGTLNGIPEYETNSEASEYLNIRLNEYPNITFEPTFSEYVHYNTDFEKRSKTSDTIILGIKTIDYEKSISKTKEKKYYEKHINTNLISVYHIEKNGVSYFNNEISNSLEKEDKSYGWIVSIISLVLFYCCILIWKWEIVKILENKKYYRIAEFISKLKTNED